MAGTRNDHRSTCAASSDCSKGSTYHAYRRRRSLTVASSCPCRAALRSLHPPGPGTSPVLLACITVSCNQSTHGRPQRLFPSTAVSDSRLSSLPHAAPLDSLFLLRFSIFASYTILTFNPRTSSPPPASMLTSSSVSCACSPASSPPYGSSAGSSCSLWTQ